MNILCEKNLALWKSGVTKHLVIWHVCVTVLSVCHFNYLKFELGTGTRATATGCLVPNTGNAATVQIQIFCSIYTACPLF